MVYRFVKIVAKMAIQLYCRDLQLNKKELLIYDGPMMLAANHPNSFLDAIILCTIFDKPVYSLARGDAFKGSLVTSLLLSLKLLPVYRLSEGVENMEDNYKTFEQCKEIFKRKGIVLIFSEGRCINEWHLRPLKKGTARLALSSWAEGIPLIVLPVGINYSSFKKFGKNIHLYFGDFITAGDIETADGTGRSIQSFNNNLQQQLAECVYEIPGDNKVKLEAIFQVKQPAWKKVLLMVPAIAGWILHAPLYYTVKKIIRNERVSADHHDSLTVSILFLAYPLYLIVATGLTLLITRQWTAVLLLVIFPFTAWALLQLKKQFEW